MIYHNGHHDLGGLKETVARAVADLKPHRKQFDTIVATGMSGVTVAVPVALALNKPVAILRKQGDDTHAWDRWIGREDIGERVLWIDDFVSSGSTRKRVANEIAELHGGANEIVGEYMYGGEWRDEIEDRVPTLEWRA